MGLDIRVPLGLIFLITGAILAGYGVFTLHDAALYAQSEGLNLNLIWGLLMAVFGGIMFGVGRRQKWQDDPVTPRPWERDSPGQPRH